MLPKSFLNFPKRGVNYLIRPLLTPIRSKITRRRERGRTGIRFVTDGAEWSILRDGEGIINFINERHPDISAEIIHPRTEVFHKVIHFGNQWAFFNNIADVDPSNRIILTVFHWDEEAVEANRKAIVVLHKNINRVDAVITACRIMEQRLKSWGVPEEKLFMIPIGVDLDVFHPVSQDQRKKLRKKFGIPDRAVCIGSFQKDGVGWEEGLEPKLIKGPDIFVEVVCRLAKRFPVFVLLAGPARGYVMNELNKANVPFHHNVVDHPNDLAPFYQALDLYLVTSREEGGPKALTEGLASGIPLVSTRVGMVPDLIVDGENGLLADINDVDNLTKQAERLIETYDLQKQVVKNGLQTVQSYSVCDLAERHMREVYRPLLNSLN